ncbi:hypothetical protein HDU98_004608, partial [Podochytrium sp. JEL0797]
MAPTPPPTLSAAPTSRQRSSPNPRPSSQLSDRPPSAHSTTSAGTGKLDGLMAMLQDFGFDNTIPESPTATERSSRSSNGSGGGAYAGYRRSRSQAPTSHRSSLEAQNGGSGMSQVLTLANLQGSQAT